MLVNPSPLYTTCTVLLLLSLVIIVLQALVEYTAVNLLHTVLCCSTCSSVVVCSAYYKIILVAV